MKALLLLAGGQGEAPKRQADLKRNRETFLQAGLIFTVAPGFSNYEADLSSFVEGRSEINRHGCSIIH
jgi:hypothetical protein